MTYLLFYSLSFILSIVLTGYVRHYALSKNFLDIPNARSSHERPTPLSGGLAFVSLFLGGLIFFKSDNVISTSHFFAYFFPCFFVSLLGFIDDKMNLPALWRLLGHIAASGAAILILGTIPPLVLGSVIISSNLILFILTLLYLTWLLNLFNFMDGIDGLAAMEAVFVSLGMIAIYLWQGQFSLVWLPLCLCVSVAGFLCWNFPPAKIFMGDVGSGFLGLTLGLFSLVAGQVNFHYFYACLILLAIFITDATFTLIQRIIKGQPIWQAHKTHAYQRALIYGTHKTVTLIALGINLCWLFPWAFLVGTNQVPVSLGLIIAYCPLVLLFFLIEDKSNHPHLRIPVA